MRVDREALGLVISKIFSTGYEMDTEQVLTDTTTDPVKTHVNRLRHFGGDSGVGKADSTFIVSVYSSRRLGVAGTRKDGAEVAGYLAVAKHRSIFGLGDSRDNDRNEGAKAVDGGVAMWARGVSRSKVVDPPGDAFGVRAGQERSIRVYSKAHVRRIVDEISEGVLGSISK